MTARITSDIDMAVSALNAGEVVAIPTETVYGLAARMDKPTAVRRVFDIKGRPYDHPLIVHDSDLEKARRWAQFNPDALALAEAYWPGPLTLLLPRTSLVPDGVTGGRSTVAIRVPAHPVARRIIAQLNYAIVAPSANRFGRVSPTTAEHVVSDLGDDVSLIVDGGECSVGVESTIVDCSGAIPQILRPGIITRRQIETSLGHVADESDGDSRAPGMLASHYAPRCAVELVRTPEEAEALQVTLRQAGRTASIIDHTADLALYARTLYSELRAADDKNLDAVIAVLPECVGLGEAICDRLRKAATR